jgi:hypothetical protein
VEVGDAQAVAEVKRMRLMSMRSRIEHERRASCLLGQRDQPGQHGLAVAFRACAFISHQVIHIERLAAPQQILHTEASHRNDGAFRFKKGELIPLRLLRLDTANELRLNQCRPKLPHHREAAIDLARYRGNLNGRHERGPATTLLSREDA